MQDTSVLPPIIVHVIEPLRQGPQARASVRQAKENVWRNHPPFVFFSPNQALRRAFGGARHPRAVAVRGLGQNVTLPELLQMLRHIAQRLWAIKKAHAHKRLIIHTHGPSALLVGQFLALKTRADAVVHRLCDLRHCRIRSKLTALDTQSVVTGSDVATGFVAADRDEMLRAEADGIVRPKALMRVVRWGHDFSSFAPRRSASTKTQAHAMFGAPRGGSPVVLSVLETLTHEALSLLLPIVQRVLLSVPEVMFVIAVKKVTPYKMRMDMQDNDVVRALTVVQTHRDVASLMYRATCLLHVTPSSSLPDAVAFAMASGRAVVAYKARGLNDAIEDHVTGLLVAPGEVQALSCALLGLLHDPKRAMAMGELARRRASYFSDEQMLLDLKQLYEELIDAA